MFLYFRKEEENTRERDTSFSAKQAHLFVKSEYLILQTGIPKRYPLFLIAEEFSSYEIKDIPQSSLRRKRLAKAVSVAAA